MAILTLPRCRSLFRAPLLLSESHCLLIHSILGKGANDLFPPWFSSCSFAFKIFSQASDFTL